MSFKGRAASRVYLPFGLDHADIKGQSSEPPQLELPVHGPLTPFEDSSARQALALSKLLYDGEFFTGSPSDKPATGVCDPIERYSDRYVKVKRVRRSIDEYPYHLEFFPEELNSVMGVTKKKKKLLLSKYNANGGFENFAIQSDSLDAESMLDKLKTLAEELDADPSAQQNDDEPEEEEYDDEFEDEDDDDYNAEKYFDDGDDEGADDGDEEAAF